MPKYAQDPSFYHIQQRAIEELGTELHYRRIDVRDSELLETVIREIADREGRMDGLVAAAGIQQEVPALEMSAKDANTMFEINITGAMMTARAIARQMIRFGNGGSIVMIASMSGTIANKVSLLTLSTPAIRISPAILGSTSTFYDRILSAHPTIGLLAFWDCIADVFYPTGPHLCRLQR